MGCSFKLCGILLYTSMIGPIDIIFFLSSAVLYFALSNNLLYCSLKGPERNLMPASVGNKFKFDLTKMDTSNMYRDGKPDHFSLSQVTSEHHDIALDVIKQYYLSEHILVQSRNMDITNDCALDEYLVGLLKQGNSLFARAEDGSIAGLCVSFASSPVDPTNLRNYAFYRQDPNTKDFLYFTAKLQETPNLWDVFKQQKVYEIKMITVLPEFRRQGLAAFLAEKSKELAHDQGYNVIRMDCINPFDYKIAERCMLQCIVKFPLHKLRGVNAPFIKKKSEFNRCVRVYVDARSQPDVDRTRVRSRQQDLESLIE